jgi:hypothetical protein
VLQRLGARLSYANVAATLALFLALGGDVSDCAMLATARTTTDSHGANAEPLGGDPDGVDVFITSGGGQTADDFSLAVFC